MFLIGQELTILTSTQRTALTHIITDMHYFKTIMTIIIRHSTSLVQDSTLRDTTVKIIVSLKKQALIEMLRKYYGESP